MKICDVIIKKRFSEEINFSQHLHSLFKTNIIIKLVYIKSLRFFQYWYFEKYQKKQNTQKSILICYEYGSRKPIYKILNWMKDPTQSVIISCAILVGLVFVQFTIVLLTKFLKTYFSSEKEENHNAKNSSSTIEISTVRKFWRHFHLMVVNPL